MSEEKQKKIGKFLITLEGNLRDTWSSLGLRSITWYEVIVYFGQKKWVIDKESYDNKALAIKAYSNIKTVSDVHKYLIFIKSDR